MRQDMSPNQKFAPITYVAMRLSRTLIGMTVSLFLITFTLINPNPASANDCPQQWNLKLPAPSWKKVEMPAKKRSSDYTDPAYTALVPNFTAPYGGTPGELSFNWQDKGMYFETFWTPTFGTEVVQKLKNLGSNAAYQFRLVEFPKLTSKGPEGQYVGGESSALRVSNYQDKTLVYPSNDSFWTSGIVNGTRVQFELDLFVRGCEKLSLVSSPSTIDFVKLPDEISVDEWLRNLEAFYKEIGRPLNGIRVDNYKKVLSRDIEQIRNGTRNSLSEEFKRLQYSRDEEGPVVMWIVGVEPGNCMLDAVNPRIEAVVYKKPCRYVISVRHLWSASNPFGDIRALGYFTIPEFTPAELAAKAKAEAAKKKSTITCVKGKLTKKLSAVNPKCPKGYKKK